MSEELQAKWNRVGCGRSEKAGKVMVARAESPARLDDKYRSGWVRTPSVSRPMGLVSTYVPQDSSGSAASRSDSCPGLRGVDLQRGLQRSSSAGALRKEHWQPDARVDVAALRGRFQKGGAEAAAAPRAGPVSRYSPIHACVAAQTPLAKRNHNDIDIQDALSVRSSSSTAAPQQGTDATMDSVPSSPAPAASEIAKIDAAELDDKFEAWFQEDSKYLRPGLSAALGELCKSLDGDTSALRGVLKEYLARMKSKLSRWLQESDPAPDEIADSVTWLVTEAKPALERFERSEAQDEQDGSWQKIADALEYALLSAWESRSCDDVSRKIDRLYLLSKPGNSRAQLVVDMLTEVKELSRAWQTHAAASGRATSVLTAGLNAVLRSHRAAMRSYGEALEGAPTCADGRQRNMVNKAWKEISKRTAAAKRDAKQPTLPLQDLVTAASEVGRFVEVSREDSADIFTALAVAFEHEVEKICNYVVEKYFAQAADEQIRNIRFSGLHRAAVKDDISTLASACGVADSFLESNFAGCTIVCTRLASGAIARLLCARWAKEHHRSQPKASLSLSKVVRADISILQSFADRWSAYGEWKDLTQEVGPLRPLLDVQEILDHASV